MPGFRIDKIGGNETNADHRSRYYTSFSWDITSLFTLEANLGGPNERPSGSALNVPRTLMLRTCSLPQTTFERIEAKGTVQYKFAGSPKFEDVRLSWYDTEFMNRTLRRWFERIYNREDGVRVPTDYKRSTVIRKYLADRIGRDARGVNNPDGLVGEAVDYTLFGSWPIAYKESELTYLEASIKNVEMTITFDDYTVSIGTGDDSFEAQQQ